MANYTYTPFKYKEFEESEEALGAKGSLSNANDALTNLGDFNWVDQGKLDDYTSQYQNRDKFSYDFNTDALYQQYKDKYIKQAKMASADVMGQASAMTGGYGSSYAQTVGNQAYQSSLDQLNDVIPELYQLAYDKYNQEGQDLLNNISLLRGERDFAYGQYNDEYTKLANDRDYWSNMYNNLYNRDYTQYSSDRTFEQTNHNTAEGYKYQADRDAIADAQWEKNYGLSERQLAMEEEAWQLQKDEYQKSIDSTTYSGKGTTKTGTGYDNGSYSDSVVKQAQKFVGASADGKWGPNSTAAAKAAGYNSLADVVKAMGGSVGGNGTLDLSAIPGINTNDTSWFDDSGNFKKAEYIGKTADGKASFRIDGKNVTFAVGVNPYTETVNPDVKKGTFSNGYQPNNIGGKKLTKTGIQDYVNGVLQNVWQTKDGKKWIWDGLKNKYLEYQE